MTQVVKRIYRGVTSYLQYWRGNPVASFQTMYSTPFYVRNPYNEDITVTFKANNNTYNVAVYYRDNRNSGSWKFLGDTSTTGITKVIPAGGTVYFAGETQEGMGWGYIYSGSNKYNRILGAPIVGGNIMSLLSRSDFENMVTIRYIGTFYRLFYDNDDLVDASELILPALTLNHYCYEGMFQSCNNLVSAPALPAPTLVVACYAEMFYGCGKLQSVECLATNHSANGCTSNWMYGTPAQGIFIRKTGVTWGRSNSAVPSGWTIVDK